jgi:hypothetical protein
MGTDQRRSANREARPTISETLDEFLRGQDARLSPRTFAHYRSIVQLLTIYLNDYGPGGLDDQEVLTYRRLYDEGRREFCDIFGPERILVHTSIFIRYFMVRKVAPGKALLHASGTVTKRLATWLAEQGYVRDDEARAFGESAIETAREAVALQQPSLKDRPTLRENLVW